MSWFISGNPPEQMHKNRDGVWPLPFKTAHGPTCEPLRSVRMFQKTCILFWNPNDQVAGEKWFMSKD